MYRPTEAAQMTTAMRLQIPTGNSKRVNGVLVKEYADNPDIVFVNFKTFGGTERTSNNVYIVEDTAQIVCWYRPDIKSDCRMVRLSDGAVYEIIGEPENLEMRNMFLKFKIRRVKGGA